jgi:hypothetical protein
MRQDRRPRAGWALACAACLLLAPLGRAAPGDTRAPPSAKAICRRMADERLLTYRNPRFRLTMTYPSSFTLDPGSVPESGDSARFWTADREATAVVTAMRNGLADSLANLLREARRDVLENSGGSITYERTRDNWFVISGYMGDRIYYRRTLLSRGSALIGTLWIEFPRALRPCYEAAVTTMSLSFRQDEPP